MRVAALALLLVVAAAVGGLVTGARADTTRVSELRLVRLATASSPVYATQAPGEPGRVYVVEQGGLVRVLERGRWRAAPFLDVRRLVVAGGEQGLLGLAFPADYARSRVFYVNYTQRADGATVVARFRVANGRALPSSRKVLLRVGQPYANHNGGNLQVGPDRLLWVGLGDGGSGGDPENRAQNPSTLLGKLFTLDVRTAAPKPVLVGLGLRNPWRYSFDRATGDLWIGDVGQNAVEEIDVVRKGTTGLLNFGWDVYEGSRVYEQKQLGRGTLVKPVAEYGHEKGCSVTGGYVYRGKAIPALVGRYLFGDYCSGTVWSMPAAGGATRVEALRVPQLASFGESLTGELYAVSGGGGVYRIAG